MPSPCCPKCGNTSFQMEELKVRDSNFPPSAIVCVMCGCVVGIQERINVTHMLRKIAEKVGAQF